MSWGVVLIALIFSLGQHIQVQRDDSIANVRSFYGVLHVYEYDAGGREHERAFFHGRINHGSQWFSGRRPFMPSTYYGLHSGVAIAFESSNDWVLVTDNPEFLQDPKVLLKQAPWPTDEPKPILWTDNFNNLFGVL